MGAKDAYVSKLEAQLKEWGAELSGLKASTQKAIAQGRIDFQKKLEDSESTQQRAQQKLQELKKAGENQWEALKTGVDSAWSELRHAIDDLKH
jgi:hypothetical protein